MLDAELAKGLSYLAAGLGRGCRGQNEQNSPRSTSRSASRHGAFLGDEEGRLAGGVVQGDDQLPTGCPLVARAAQHHAGQRPARTLAPVGGAARVRAGQPNPVVAALDAMAGHQLLVPGVEVAGQLQNLRHLVHAGPARRDPAEAAVTLPRPPPRSDRASAGRCAPTRPTLLRLGSTSPDRCDRSLNFLSPCSCSVRRHLLEAFRTVVPDISSVTDSLRRLAPFALCHFLSAAVRSIVV